MKIICELLHPNLIVFSPHIGGWLVGMEELSNRAPHLFTLDEIKRLIDQADTNQQFVSINASKIFTTSELKAIQPLLLNLSMMKIKYIFYTDLGFYQVAKNFNLPLVYQASTYLTNSYDVNLALNQNENVIVSPEISLNELKAITNQAKKEVMIEVFGRTIIFHSRRKLLTNYFNYRGINHLNPNDKNHTIIEELRRDFHPIEEDINGTHIYSSGFYYLLEELSEIKNVAYIIIRTQFITFNQAKNVLDIYLEYLSTGNNSIHQLTLPLSKGLLNQSSILLKEEKTR